MKTKQHPFALAALALLAGAPFAAHAAPTVSFKSPTSGQTISGNLYQSSACEVAGSNIKSVKFYLGSTALNTEGQSPWQCNLDTRKFSDGTHTLKAVAFDSAGASQSAQISVNIQNGTTTGGSTGGSTSSGLSFTKPSDGQTISGSINQSSACEVIPSGISVSKVRFFLNSTALNIEGSKPWQCNIDTRKFADGSYTLKAEALNSSGSVTGTAQVAVNIQNGTTGTTNAAPSLSITSPSGGTTVSGGSVACAANASDSDGVAQVSFFLDSATTAFASSTSAPYTCSFDSTKLSNGGHTLKAVATDTLGASRTTQVSFNVSNGTTSGGTSSGLSFKSPSDGQTISGNLYQSSACEVTPSGISLSKVRFFLNGTALNTEGSAPWQCNLDTRKFQDGSYTLKAEALNSSGSVTGTAQIAVKIQNGTTSGGTGGGTTSGLSFTAPASGQTISGAINQSSACEVVPTGITVSKVRFFLNSTALNIEGSKPWQCNIDTRNFANGDYTLKAEALNSSGAVTGTAQVAVKIQNGTTGTTNTPPTVSLTAPSSGATLSGTMTFAATASDSDGVEKVDFYLVNSSGAQTLIGSDTTNDYGGTYNTAQLPNGTYQLMAVATDKLGAPSTTQRAVTISNTGGDSGGGSGGGSGTTLPANGASAVATFESLGLYWRPGSDPGAGCSVRYRKFSESAWREALPMWYDSRNSECRGSIVHLEPGTDYAVEMGVGTSFQAGVNTRTWSESFPIAKTVQVQSGSQTLAITEGGTPQGYVLYTGPATIDVANAADYSVRISAPYVIVRGLTLRGARRDAVRLSAGAHDVVVEDNDISNWGAFSGTTLGGVQVGTNKDAGIRADCFGDPFLERAVLQRNRIHDPRYGANSWDYGHPLGPVGIDISHCGGNHVIRYNEIYSTEGRYFKDGMGGGSNFSAVGFPNADSDIYGNIVTHVWDDAISAEGGNRNTRLWGNYMDQTATGIATTVVHVGPAYIFRNVYNRSRHFLNRALDDDGRLYFSKSGSSSEWGDGRRYVFHNTLLQARQDGVQNGLGAGEGVIGFSAEPLTNTVTRNNILHVWKASAASIRTAGGSGNDFDYDLRNGGISAYAGAEANGIVGTPIYRSGHGWANWAGGNYQLDTSSPGYDRGVRIPNFNDGFTGAGPDMGAHEGDTPAMRLGLGGGGTSTAISGGTTSGGGTTTTTTTVSSGGGGACSTIDCAAQ